MPGLENRAPQPDDFRGEDSPAMASDRAKQRLIDGALGMYNQQRHDQHASGGLPIHAEEFVSANQLEDLVGLSTYQSQDAAIRALIGAVAICSDDRDVRSGAMRLVEGNFGNLVVSLGTMHRDPELRLDFLNRLAEISPVSAAERIEAIILSKADARLRADLLELLDEIAPERAGKFARQLLKLEPAGALHDAASRIAAAKDTVQGNSSLAAGRISVDENLLASISAAVFEPSPDLQLTAAKRIWNSSLQPEEKLLVATVGCQIGTAALRIWALEQLCSEAPAIGVSLARMLVSDKDEAVRSAAQKLLDPSGGQK